MPRIGCRNPVSVRYSVRKTARAKQKKNQWGWSMSSYQKRRISEQTYKFPKCTFSIFPSSQYTIYIYFLCDVVQPRLLLLVEHETFFSSLPIPPAGPLRKVVAKCARWGDEARNVFRQQDGKGKWRGRLGTAKENQYVSDKKAQILDASGVWVRKEKHTNLFPSLTLCQSWRIYGRERRFLCIQFIAKKTEKRKMKEFSHRSLQKKLNWKFSIIYIWGKKLFASAFALIPPSIGCAATSFAFHEIHEMKKTLFWWRWSFQTRSTRAGGVEEEMEWQSCVAINFLDIH